MTGRNSAMAWCCAGLLLSLLAGLALASARDLSSATERLAAVDLGPWLDGTNLGVGLIPAKFGFTPVTAWWLAGTGMVIAWIGWRARRAEASLSFGLWGGLICLTTVGILTTQNLLVLWGLISLQCWIGVIWLARRQSLPNSGCGWRAFLAAQLTADVCSLTGVFMAGIAWGTLDLVSLSDGEFLQTGWRNHPVACGAAGTWLFLGLICRCGWFPWLPGSRIAVMSSPRSIALLFGGCLWPCWSWWWLMISPLLECAPETVSLVQAGALLAAVIAAFVATAQTDARRTALLLASAQFGVMLSAGVLAGLVSPLQLGLAIITLSIATSRLLTQDRTTQTVRFTDRWAWWLLAGGCLSPLFSLAGTASERIPNWEPPAAHSTTNEEAPPDNAAYRVRPLPIINWTAAWCLYAFFAGFSARRAASESGSAQHAVASRSSGDLLEFSALTILTALAGWLAWRDISSGELWPSVVATAAGLAGWSLASSLCHADQIAVRFQRLGLWFDWSRPEGILDEGPIRAASRFVRRWADSTRHCDDRLFPTAASAGGEWLITRLKGAEQELRSEPATVYAVAFALTVGSLIVTWMSLLD